MTWGCKAENYPDGCGWSSRLTYPRLGYIKWWCDSCERAGTCLTSPAKTIPVSDSTPEAGMPP